MVHAFCVMNMPVSVPVKPVIAEKISLFHLLSVIRWVISMAVRLSVMAIANFTPRTKRGSGWISRCRFRLVKAFLIGSFMGYHLLLFYAFCATGALSADKKTV